MGIADVCEKIVVKMEEHGKQTVYIKEVGTDQVVGTPYIEEALTFQNAAVAANAIKALVSFNSGMYRTARAMEAIEPAEGSITISSVRIDVKETPILSTVIQRKE